MVRLYGFTASDAQYYNKCALYQIGIDGSGLQEIAGVECNGYLVWSPDGSKFAISHIGAFKPTRYEYGEVLLYTMAAGWVE